MICCITGHRTKGFPFKREDEFAYYAYLEKLYCTIEQLIREDYRYFITGMAEGADIDFAECVLSLREKGENIALEAALPYPDRPHKTITEYAADRRTILARCNYRSVISPQYFKGCFEKRNRYMVDKSDLVLAVWNGRQSGGTWNTINYAKESNKPIRYLMLNEFVSSEQ